ncbi:MAG: riboflavin synthase [Phycisphaerales bacterium]
MFTGLIEGIGTVSEARQTEHGLRLIIDPGADAAWAANLTSGESIAVAGVCLTARHPDRILPHAAPLHPTTNPPAPTTTPPNTIAFDVVRETLDRTTLARLRPGDRVNLERAVRAATLMGGHFVQGHIDTVGTVHAVQQNPADWRLTIAIPAPLMDAMIPKGSVAIDGVSLTIARIDHTPQNQNHGLIDIALIPTTLERTTLAALQPGDPVNIEADMLAKAVIATVERMRSNITTPRNT